MPSARMAVTDGRGKFAVVVGTVGPPGPHEVQVKMTAAGICHTDWDSLNWGDTLVLGHEGSAVVTEVGAGVTRVRVGDAVVLNWAIPCGKCRTCRQGMRNICLVNSSVTGSGDRGHAHAEATLVGTVPTRRSFHLGTLSEYAVVREEAVREVAPTLNPQAMALIGCGVMTGFGSAVNVAQVRPGQSVAVIGCGGVGINVLQGCRVAGASRIFAIDVATTRLERSRYFGATDLIEVAVGEHSMRQPRQAITELLGEGVEVAFECTGQPGLAAAPLELVRHGGTAVQVSGSEQRLDFRGDLFFWDKTYRTPLYGGCDPDRDIPMLIDHYLAGRLLLDEQISSLWSLDQLDEAFRAMLEGPGGKSVVVFG